MPPRPTPSTGAGAALCGRPAVGRFMWGADNREGYLCARHREEINSRLQDPDVMNHTPLKAGHGKTCTEPPFATAPALPPLAGDADPSNTEEV